MMGDKLKTHEDGVAFVKSIFHILGPPRRHRHIDTYELMTREMKDFLMDFENACLSQDWDSSKREHPKGPDRYKDPEWAAMIQSQVYPHHSDLDWIEYVAFCENGGGDEWFQEEDEPEVKMEKRQVMKETRCPGCGRGDDFCRCGSFDGGGGSSSLWWGN